jgi:hypothetical protein
MNPLRHCEWPNKSIMFADTGRPTRIPLRALLIARSYSLKDVPRAIEDMESRKMLGRMIVTPGGPS